jgi:phosphatidylglycerophosphate synthase
MVPVMMVQENWIAAGLWLLAAGFFDILDGSLARYGGFKSTFGAFWDSTLDRVSEAIVFAGFLLYYYQHQNQSALLLAFGVSILSWLIPYTRARAEGLGIHCEVGILPRPARLLLLAFGFLVIQPTPALVIVGVLSLVTVLQRVFWVWDKTKR